MNQFNQFEEDLSEEFLDENVSVSNINVSRTLEENMSKPLFNSRIILGKEAKSKSCPFNKLKLCKPSRVPKLSNDNFLAVPSKIIASHKNSKASSSRSNLQSDIKALLNKAIRIRSLSNDAAHKKYTHTTSNLNNKFSCQEGEHCITVHDCATPSS
ncbi:unnamed protein product [Moneuplotes crassus]|uniref:Uncharacterized protein n=1 Tax=Euplotes crassus TaxID=5936 RepID=A0AAD1XDM2_EUPCR|nr:unnamed protein product [Moneuplotes crassus]